MGQNHSRDGRRSGRNCKVWTLRQLLRHPQGLVPSRRLQSCFRGQTHQPPRRVQSRLHRHRWLYQLLPDWKLEHGNTATIRGTLLPPREERRGGLHPQERPQESRGGYSEDLGYGQAVQWLSREKFFQEKPGNFQPPPRMSVPKPTQLQGKTSPRDISEPPPTANKKRLPLPDIFYYGDRWQEQETRNSETRSRSTHQVSSGSSLETPEPPPGSSDIIANNNNNNR